jgi:gluconokinase
MGWIMRLETMVILIMGVAGSGKTTIGSRLAAGLGWEFIDADNYHSPHNIAKMAAGISLTESDREPWLEKLNTKLTAEDSCGVDVIVACSALTQPSRNTLLKDIKHIGIVDLQGDYELIEARISNRAGHFFNEKLLMSQFEAYEKPKEGLCVSIQGSPEEIVAVIVAAFGLSKSMVNK